ncbi:hypothetical protein KTE64_22360, partial [Burkholderia multivorans]|uniref:hypothetical protein n=1 Tax=Burkholderia multivorans TaxID=87883 RepID=UPI001C21B682
DAAYHLAASSQSVRHSVRRAIHRRHQLRSFNRPQHTKFLTRPMLTEEEQKLAASAAMRHLAEQMNPQNPALGRYQVISLIDAGNSLRQRLGPAVDEALKLASAEAAPRYIIPRRALPEAVAAA